MVNQEESMWQPKLESNESTRRFIGPDRFGFYQTELITENDTIPLAICINPDLLFSGSIRELDFKFNNPNVSNGDTINGGRYFISKQRVDILSDLWLNKLGKPSVHVKSSDSLFIKWSNDEFSAEFMAKSNNSLESEKFPSNDYYLYSSARIRSSQASELFQKANEATREKRSPEVFLKAVLSSPRVFLAVDRDTKEKSYIITHDNIDFRHINKKDFRSVTAVRFSIGYFDQFGILLFESPTYDFIPDWPLEIKPIWEMFGDESPNGMKISFSLDNVELDIGNENATLSNLRPALNYAAITLEDGTTISQ